jgi:hypothetical protein
MMLRHTIKPDGEGYHVGYYDPAAARWEMIAEVENLEQAAALASYLNGGDKPTGPIRDRHDA